MDFSTLVAAIVAIVAITGGVWKIVDGFNSKLDRTLKDVNENLKTNTSLLFKRFDDHKQSVDDKLIKLQEANDRRYATLGICEMTRDVFSKKMDDISRKIDLLLEERRNK